MVYMWYVSKYFSWSKVLVFRWFACVLVGVFQKKMCVDVWICKIKLYLCYVGKRIDNHLKSRSCFVAHMINSNVQHYRNRDKQIKRKKVPYMVV